MKDKLLREIEIKLSLQFPEEQRAEDSVFFWDTDGPMIPEGWYETADYGSSNLVDDFVIGWQPLPDPWET